MSRVRIACLLPARNAAEDLPGYLDAVARLADAVIALDDGSTDETGQLLAASPLVRVLLRNPRRKDDAGWDDGANRNRLLVAAAELEPEWILSLDVDERIDAEDAAALREFVERDGLPGVAYGFPVFSMLEDQSCCDPIPRWVFRLFAFESGQRFPDRRLHSIPIPTSIPRKRWLRTTVRIQRQASYAHLLSVPRATMTWGSRPPGLPVRTEDGGEARVLVDRERGDPALEKPVRSAGLTSPDFDRLAENYDRLRPVDNNWWQLFEVLLAEGALAEQRVLDVGCGTGRMAAALGERGSMVCGIDTSKEMLKQARANAGRSASFSLGRAEALPFKDGCFDRAVLRLVVHLFDRPRAWRELARVLRAAGKIVVATFDPAWLARSRVNRLFPSLGRLDRERYAPPEVLDQELQAAGFAHVKTRRLSLRNRDRREQVLERIRGRSNSALLLSDEQMIDKMLEWATRELPDEIEYKVEWIVLAAERRTGLDENRAMRPGEES